MHALKNRIKMNVCRNPDIKASNLEDSVFKIIEDTLFDETKLKSHMDFFKRRTLASQQKINKDLDRNNQALTKQKQAKKRLVELYTQGDIEQEEYTKQNLILDELLTSLKQAETDLIGKIPLLNKKKIVDLSIKQFCINALINYQASKTFETKRDFLLRYISSITYNNQNILLRGTIPIDDSTDLERPPTLDFCISGSFLRPRKRQV